MCRYKRASYGTQMWSCVPKSSLISSMSPRSVDACGCLFAPVIHTVRRSQYLVDLNNYNGVMQFCAAFQSASVSRLKKAWGVRCVFVAMFFFYVLVIFFCHGSCKVKQQWVNWRESTKYCRHNRRFQSCATWLPALTRPSYRMSVGQRMCLLYIRCLCTRVSYGRCVYLCAVCWCMCVCRHVSCRLDVHRRRQRNRCATQRTTSTWQTRTYTHVFCRTWQIKRWFLSQSLFFFFFSQIFSFVISINIYIEREKKLNCNFSFLVHSDQCWKI